jgi:hypothetical protein
LESGDYALSETGEIENKIKRKLKEFEHVLDQPMCRNHSKPL